jgi:hypothetical protein
MLSCRLPWRGCCVKPVVMLSPCVRSDSERPATRKSLFQDRFKSTIIKAEKYLLEVSRYLHLNPVRGVVLGQGTPMERRKRLREYRWSSYRGYAGLEKMKSFLDSEPI